VNWLFDLEPEEFAKLRPGSRPSLVEFRYSGALRQDDHLLWLCSDLHLSPGTAVKCAEREMRRRLRMVKRHQQLVAWRAARERL
jgi:hypothetical protein